MAAFSFQPYIGFIGVTIGYEDGLNGPSFFERNPSPIVQVTGASPWKIRAMMATGLIRNPVAHRFKETPDSQELHHARSTVLCGHGRKLLRRRCIANRYRSNLSSRGVQTRSTPRGQPSLFRSASDASA